MKYFVINNPNSGNANRHITLDLLYSKFSSKHEIILKETAYKFHAKELVKEAIKKNVDVVIACGGDGTINEVASALINSKIKLGIIPSGSGNGLATNLGIKKDINRAIDIIKNSNIYKIDVGKIEENYFFSNLGFGIDADVILSYEKMKRRKISGYIYSSFNSLINYKPKLYRVKFEGSIIEKKFYYLFCSNSNTAGYGVSFTPKADLSDGLLDLLMIEDLNILEQFYFAVLVLTKKINLLNKASYKKIKQFSIEKLGEGDIIYQIDGESHITKSNKLDINILPKALNVIY